MGVNAAKDTIDLCVEARITKGNQKTAENSHKRTRQKKKGY